MRQGCESGEVDLSKGGTLDEKLWNGDEEGGVWVGGVKTMLLDIF